MSYYVVKFDLLFLGLHVEAEDEEQAIEKAQTALEDLPDVSDVMGVEMGIIGKKALLVEDEDKAWLMEDKA